MREAEEVVGSVFLEIEQYPDAVIHYQRAMALADTPSIKAYEAVNEADALWRLGRYDESQKMLTSIPADKNFAAMVNLIDLPSLLSRNKYSEALILAKQMITSNSDDPSEQQEFAMYKLLAESHLGAKRQTSEDLENLKNRPKTGDSNTDATTELAIIEASLNTGSTQYAWDQSAGCGGVAGRPCDHLSSAIFETYDKTSGIKTSVEYECPSQLCVVCISPTDPCQK